MDAGLRSVSNLNQATGDHGRAEGTVYAASVSHNMYVPTFRSSISVQSTATAMQNAEMNALVEGQKAKNKLIEKQIKVDEFRAKTATIAQQRLKQQKAEAKKEADLKKAKEVERLVKAKEYAAKQREMAVKKANQKKR